MILVKPLIEPLNEPGSKLDNNILGGKVKNGHQPDTESNHTIITPANVVEQNKKYKITPNKLIQRLHPPPLVPLTRDKVDNVWPSCSGKCYPPRGYCHNRWCC